MGLQPKPQEDETATPATETLTLQHGTTDDFVYPAGWRLALIMIAIFTGMFLVALVRSRWQILPPEP